MRVLVVVNAKDAPAGLVAERIAARGGAIVMVLPHDGAPLPETPTGYDGLVVLGGTQDAWDDADFPAFAAIRRLCRMFDKQGRPVLAICLGAQLLAQALSLIHI